jgi:hypothetical protein
MEISRQPASVSRASCAELMSSEREPDWHSLAALNLLSRAIFEAEPACCHSVCPACLTWRFEFCPDECALLRDDASFVAGRLARADRANQLAKLHAHRETEGEEERDEVGGDEQPGERGVCLLMMLRRRVWNLFQSSRPSLSRHPGSTARDSPPGDCSQTRTACRPSQTRIADVQTAGPPVPAP